jgi:hypothetical protein
VTGGAGAGANTTVNIHNNAKPDKKGKNKETTPREVAQKGSNTAKATPATKATSAETPTGTDSSTNVNH